MTVLYHIKHLQNRTNSPSIDIYKELPKTLNTGDKHLKCKLSNGIIHRVKPSSYSVNNRSLANSVNGSSCEGSSPGC